MKKINEIFHTPNWLLWLLVIVLVLRIPSLFEPYSYGDEMIYLTLGEGVRRGVPLYLGLHDNKPPLLYLTAAVSGSLFVFRSILAIWSLTTVYLFWKLTDTLFPKRENLQKVSTAIFAVLTTIPLLEGNVANSELFMIGPTILAFVVLLKKANVKSLVEAGLLFSIAALYKIPAAFDIPAIVVFWMIGRGFNSKNIVATAKKSLWILTGFAAPIAATFVWYWAQGAFNEYLVAAYLQNFGYLSSWRPDDVVEPFLVKNGPLLLRGGLVLVGMFVLYLARKKISKQFLFVVAWLFMGLFAVTLSERPYPHYLIQTIPAVSLLFGMFFTKKTLEQSLTIIPLSLFFLVPVYYKFWYYPTTSYYARFASFATGRLTQEEYRSSFGGNVVRNYKISEYIVGTTQKDDKIFVWGDNSTIYALSRRLPPFKYVVDYHIRDFSAPEETISALENNKPELVVVLPNVEELAGLRSFYTSGDYALTKTIDEAEIWRLIK